MKTIKIKIIILAVVIFSANSCVKKESENCHLTIKVKNNSAKDIYIDASGYYPDTLSYQCRALVNNKHTDKAIAGSENTLALFRRSCYEAMFKDGRQYQHDTLMVFILDAKLLESTPCDEYNVLQRYDLSLEDLQRMNWQISYPPTAEMKDVKMFPPYGN